MDDSPNKKPDGITTNNTAEQFSQDFRQRNDVKLTQNLGYIQSRTDSDSIFIPLYGSEFLFKLSRISYFAFTESDGVLFYRMSGKQRKATGKLGRILHAALKNWHEVNGGEK